MSPQLEEKTSVCEFLFSCMYGQTVFFKKKYLYRDNFSIQNVYRHQGGNLQLKQQN